MTKTGLVFASLTVCLMQGAYAQVSPNKDLSVCMEHIGTRGFIEVSLLVTPLIVSSSKAAVSDCHNDFMNRAGKDEFAVSWVVSPSALKRFVAEVSDSPSLSSSENQPLGTYRFVVIAPDGKTVKNLDKAQTVTVLRKLMQMCRRTHVYPSLRDFTNWLDSFQPFPASMYPAPDHNSTPGQPAPEPNR